MALPLSSLPYPCRYPLSFILYKGQRANDKEKRYNDEAAQAQGVTIQQRNRRYWVGVKTHTPTSRKEGEHRRNIHKILDYKPKFNKYNN